MFPIIPFIYILMIQDISQRMMGNSNSRILPSYPQPPSYFDLGSLLDLAPNEKAWVLAALGNDPLKRAKTILQNPHIGKPGHILSSCELSMALDHVYSSFRSNWKVDETYIITLLEAIVDRVRIEGERMDFWIQEIVILAARMVKGEACEECREADYKSPIRGSLELVQCFASTIEELEAIAGEKGIEVGLTSKGRFSLNKLCSIYYEFRSLRHLADIHGVTDDLEEMWCHEGEECDTGCWDGGGDDLHSDWCRSRPADAWDVDVDV
jgi:hypothetical protein